MFLTFVLKMKIKKPQSRYIFCFGANNTIIAVPPKFVLCRVQHDTRDDITVIPRQSLLKFGLPSKAHSAKHHLPRSHRPRFSVKRFPCLLFFLFGLAMIILRTFSFVNSFFAKKSDFFTAVKLKRLISFWENGVHPRHFPQYFRSSERYIIASAI